MCAFTHYNGLLVTPDIQNGLKVYFSSLFNLGVILDPQFPMCDKFKSQGLDIRLHIKF